MSQNTTVMSWEQIASVSNAPEIFIISQSASRFKNDSEKTPADVLGLFTKRSAVKLVRAGYISAKSGMSPEAVKKYLDAIDRAWSDIDIVDDSRTQRVILEEVKENLEAKAPNWKRRFDSASAVLEAIMDGSVSVSTLEGETLEAYNRLVAFVENQLAEQIVKFTSALA